MSLTSRQRITAYMWSCYPWIILDCCDHLQPHRINPILVSTKKENKRTYLAGGSCSEIGTIPSLHKRAPAFPLAPCELLGWWRFCGILGTGQEAHGNLGRGVVVGKSMLGKCRETAYFHMLLGNLSSSSLLLPHPTPCPDGPIEASSAQYAKS